MKFGDPLQGLVFEFWGNWLDRPLLLQPGVVEQVPGGGPQVDVLLQHLLDEVNAFGGKPGTFCR